ncbi:MAG: winged helix-turn-helix transcriptional regulator [Lentilitoribacter sp.]
MNILSLMYEGTAGRQATLLAKTGAGRTAFTQSLSHLIELKLVERNPGHGHPLRPEYRLTELGSYVAERAHNVSRIGQQATDSALLRRSWTLPILAASAEPIHFGGLKNKLLPITDRALSQSLKQLEACSWMQREVDITQRPARSIYHAQGRGSQIGQLISA